MAGHPNPMLLAPPAVTALKEEAVALKDPALRGTMERSVSQDIRDEREDLKRAAEQSLNAIMDLDLDGTIRWASPSWKDVSGVDPGSIVGKTVSDIIIDHKTIFNDAIAAMRKDDTKSRIIRFAIKYQLPAGEKTHPPSAENLEADSIGTNVATAEGAEHEHPVNLEAQGIMVYERTTGEEEESHTMWMIKPAVHREITIDLPDLLVESLGIGAHVLAQYLTILAEMGSDDPSDHPPPPPVLCRICERQITPWWFEKHTELCMQEHRAEMEVQMAQENLTEHRSAIVKVLDALEAQTRHSRPGSSDSGSVSPAPLAEYKGQVIGPLSQPSSGPSSGRSSPATSQIKSRDSSRSNVSHQRARSFAVRRPLARIVELVLDLCDTALEISPPAVKDNTGQLDSEIRTQSPQSESRISQVLQWSSPSTNTLETEQGLALLADDTSSLAKAKVESIFRHRRILEYSERLRIEFHILVQECIDEALAKAARIAKGEISDSSESSSTVEEDGGIDADEQQHQYTSAGGTPSDIEPMPRFSESVHDDFAIGSFGSAVAPSPMTLALRNIPESSSFRRASSAGGSSRSNSPHGTKTPRTYGSALSTLIHQKRTSMLPPPESDAGAESDSSIRSSLASVPVRTDSPAPELCLSRVTSTREHKRKSLVLPSLSGTSRQQSPTRSVAAPSSPLRVAKPRIPSGGESVPSPLTSPILSHDNFTSPVIRAQSQHLHYHGHHHRRQSSATFSESFRPPSSPRLSAVGSNPQPRAVQTSIKDFEIIKPISKGAFGSVYLAKKKVTGDYYAIKVLKKADMVAKNQVTNVKAERAIMMWQGESDFVAKLYWTFSSKDYLYLVMEYLNGGDCASLVKTLGGLPEDWAKKYLAEVVLGVQHLHDRQIVHRDLKPDNLLIDQKGHLKLTDFGLSRMGLIGRQKRMQNTKPSETSEAPDLLKLGGGGGGSSSKREPSITSSRSTSFDFNGSQSPAPTPGLTPALAGDLSQPSYFSLTKDNSRELSRRTSGHRSDSTDSDALANMFRRFSIADESSIYQRRTPIEEETASEGDSPEPYALHPVMSHMSGIMGTPPQAPGMLPPPMALFDPEDSSRRFVGTPDYLAPETINGSGQDEMSDWWSLGCILFECLYGYPPFHADSPDAVFQNILARKIDWPDDDDCPVSAEAKDLINRLMTLDPKQRLGSNIDETFSNGGDEIRHHTWFDDVDWDTLREDEASFIPAPANPEDTEYFDSRGATLQNFRAEFEDQVSSPANTPGADYPERPHDALSRVRSQVNSIKRGLMPLHIPPHVRDGRSRRLSEPVVADDFGNFQFKNLPVLEKANKDVIQKLRAEAMQAQSKASVSGPQSPVMASPSPSAESSPVVAGPIKRTLSTNKGNNRPASPSLLSQANSSPSRGSQPSSPLLVSFSAGNHHERRKTSASSSSLAQQISHLHASGGLLDAPKPPAGFKSLSAASSPIKIPKSLNGQQSHTSERSSYSNRRGSVSSPRQRSHTIGSQDDDAHPGPLSQSKRRSMALDVSPSSSDNEDQRTKALLRVQRRRQSSRRLSQITLAEGPTFRPLDVLICEDHPVSRLVMERLLEKLRCRTISVQNGSEAMRYSMSEVKFDIIMMEFKLPQINGADVARMIRDTKNANSHTPIVAVTGYLKELQAPHYFDALIEKPPVTAKLTEVMSRLCQWKPPPPGWTPAQFPTMPPSSLRRESPLTEESPTTTSSISGYGMLTNSYRGSSREDSIGSSSLGDADPQYDSIPVIISRQATNEWHDSDMERNFGGLGISPEELLHERTKQSPQQRLPALTEQISAPGKLESQPNSVPRRQRSTEAIQARKKSMEQERHECAESGDDEDEEWGNTQIQARSPKSKARGASKLGTEMLRTNSQGSVISNEEAMSTQNLKATAPLSMDEGDAIEEEGATLTPPELFERVPGTNVKVIDMDAEKTPRPHYSSEPDPDPTPRASTSPMRKD